MNPVGLIQVFIDAAILLGAVRLLLDNDAPKFVYIVLVLFGLAVAGFFFSVGINSESYAFWNLILLLIVFPFVIVTGAVALYFADFLAGRTLIAMALYTVIGIATCQLNPVVALMPIAVASGLIVMYYTDLAPKQALVALAVFTTYKIGVIATFAWLEQNARAAAAIGAGLA